MCIVTIAGAVVVAAALAAGGRRVSPRARRVVLWRGSRRFIMLLDRYGVEYEARVYSTTSYGKRYRRYKIIIRDWRVVGWLKRNYPHNLKRYIYRYMSVFTEALASLKRITTRILDVLPESILKRLTGVKPFNPRAYYKWRDRRFVRRIKPNWRGWLFMKRLKAREEFEKLLRGGEWY